MTNDRPEGNAIHGAKEPQWSFWRALGFGRAHAQRPEEQEGFAPGCLVTNIYLCVDWKDRLRLVATGKAHVQTATQTDAIVRRARSISAFRVLPPFSDEI
jgi:hypothetical protein